jgi:hypothetical protein
MIVIEIASRDEGDAERRAQMPPHHEAVRSTTRTMSGKTGALAEGGGGLGFGS